MRILVLSKRQYTGKDLLDDEYGRLFELPARLSNRGHDVRGIALSYRRRPGPSSRDLTGVKWWSVNALPAGMLAYPAICNEVTGHWRPDVIWSSSDAGHAILGRWLSRKLDVPYVVDLYDNYESFALTGVPGLRRGLRRACREADGLTVVTHALKAFAEQRYRPIGPIAVLGNGVDTRRFVARDRGQARIRLGIPEDARVIGTAGSITQDRGIDDLFQAFAEIARKDDRLWLAYAGPRDATPDLYPHARTVDLGVLPQADIPELLSALDVAVVCNKDSEFGRYCYPMKLEEAIACGTPVVAARVGDVAQRLSFNDRHLYEPGQPHSLGEKIRQLAGEPCRQSPFTAVDWDACTTILEAALASAVSDRCFNARLAGSSAGPMN